MSDGRGQHPELVLERGERLLEHVLVHRFGVRPHLEHRVAARQVQIGGDVARSAARNPAGRRAAGILFHVASSQARLTASVVAPVPPASPCTASSTPSPGALPAANGGCRRPRLFLALADPVDGRLQLALGQRVGHELVRALAQKLVQHGGADILGDQDHTDPWPLAMVMISLRSGRSSSSDSSIARRRIRGFASGWLKNASASLMLRSPQARPRRPPCPRSAGRNSGCRG